MSNLHTVNYELRSIKLAIVTSRLRAQQAELLVALQAIENIGPYETRENIRSFARAAIARAEKVQGDCSLIRQMDNILSHVEGINDERDSVGILLAVREHWPKLRAAIIRAERMQGEQRIEKDNSFSRALDAIVKAERTEP